MRANKYTRQPTKEKYIEVKVLQKTPIITNQKKKNNHEQKRQKK
jgi:hypothetical protein